MRTKAEFRALRELIGYTQQDIATYCGVNIKTAKRWENPKYKDYPIPEDAWEFLDNARLSQLETVDYALAKIDELAKERGFYPEVITLTYYRDLASFREHHPKDGDYWNAANANTRIVMDRLEEMGIETVIEYAD